MQKSVDMVGVLWYYTHVNALQGVDAKTINTQLKNTIMDNAIIAKLAIAAATNTAIAAPERALLVSNLLKGKDFKATYHKARPDYDEQGNELLRECVGTLNYEELEKHSQAYRTWLEEKEWKAAKGVVQRKEPHEYGNVQYWDYEKDSFRNFKVDNLVSLELT